MNDRNDGNNPRFESIVKTGKNVFRMKMDRGTTTRHLIAPKFARRRLRIKYIRKTITNPTVRLIRLVPYRNCK